jgi:predicted permease
MTELRLALRALARMPIVAAVIVSSLAIGIGVNTTIFSWVQSLVFQPLPGVRDASSFYLIEPRAESGTYPGTSWVEYGDLQRRLSSFESILAARPAPFNVGCEAETGTLAATAALCVPSRHFGQFVSGNFFPALGLRPARGRLIEPADAATAGAAPVAVISHAFWQSQLAGREIEGTTLRVNDRPLTLIGVAPAGFEGTASGMRFDVWVPATLAQALQPGSRELEVRGARGYWAMGRLRPGATAAQAGAELDRTMRELAHDYPDTNATMRGEVLPFWKTPRGPRQFLIAAVALLQVVMLVLLLALCGNAATLLLARATSRVREVGVRVALGASRARIVRLLLVESLLLASLGAALGVPVAIWGTEALRADVVPLTRTLPVALHTSIDTIGLLVAVALGLLSGLAFGLPPAVHLARRAPLVSLRPAAGAPLRSRARDAIVAVQVGLAMIVLLAAGLFLRVFLDTQRLDPGFRREGVLLAAYDLRGRTATTMDARVFAREILDRLRALPAVEAASIASSVPLDIHGLPLRFFSVEGRARPDGELDQALANTVTPGYFATMKIPIVAGADFADLGNATRAAEAVVNEEFVRRFLTGVDPLGRRIENGGRSFTIVAVVADSRYESFSEPPTPIVYFSYRDRAPAQGELHVRTREGAELAIGNDVRRAVWTIDPQLPVFNVRTLTEHVDANLFMQRIPARMFAVLGPLMLLMAAIGLYAVVSYAASLRTTEVGVRIALGATPRRVVAELLLDHLRIVAWGALAGWLVVFVMVADLDAAVFTIAPALLLAVAALACFVPARRAAAIDPMVALRQE